jgi:hypothetical protein
LFEAQPRQKSPARGIHRAGAWSNKMSTEREQRGAKHLHEARNAHIRRTGEPSKGPTHDDMVKEQAATAGRSDKDSTSVALPAQQEVASVKGHHNGRPHPPAMKMGGDDYAAGAENGGEVNAQNGK